MNDRALQIAGARRFRRVLVARALLGAALIAAASVSLPAQPLRDADGVIRVEISQNAGQFVFDEAPTFDTGLPAYGNPFVVQGVIYPAGTLANSINNGMNPDGTPEFPDKVIGEWTCWGRFIGNGVQTAAGGWVMSTQVFSFGEASGYGAKTIVTTGYETVDGTVERAVTGGTGKFEGAVGVQRQQVLGHNASGGLALSEEIDLDDPTAKALARIERVLSRIAKRMGLVP